MSSTEWLPPKPKPEAPPEKSENKPRSALEKGRQFAKPEDFARAAEAANVEVVPLPASGLEVLLYRPPILAALRLEEEGATLQRKITECSAQEVRKEDIKAFTDWIISTLSMLFVEPRFSEPPRDGEIGLVKLLERDMKFIFRWMRGEVSPGVNGYPEDLANFRGGQATPGVPLGSSEAQPVQAK